MTISDVTFLSPSVAKRRGFDIGEDQLLREQAGVFTVTDKQGRPIPGVQPTPAVPPVEPTVAPALPLALEDAALVAEEDGRPVVPGAPVFLTATEALQFDLQVPVDWMVKVTPAEVGEVPEVRFVLPDGQELTLEEAQELIAAQQEFLAVPTTEAQLALGAVFPDRDVLALVQWAQDSPEEFIEAIGEQGDTEETRALIARVFPDATATNIHDLFYLPQDFEDAVSATFKVKGPPEFIQFFWETITSDPNAFYADLLNRSFDSAEQAEAARQLFRFISPNVTDEGVEAFFQFDPDSGRTREEAAARLDAQGGIIFDKYANMAAADLGMTREEVSQPSGFFNQRPLDRWFEDNPEQFEAFEREMAANTFQWNLDTSGDFSRSLGAGVADVEAAAAGALRWLGLDGIAANLNNNAGDMRRFAPVAVGFEGWETLFNPRFWTTTVTRALPFTIALLPAGLGGFAAGAAVGVALGLGRWAITVLGALGATGASRPLEASLEAGGAFDAALNAGFSEEEAGKAATQVFQQNLALAGTDIIQFTAAFLPAPLKSLNNLIARGFVTTIRVGGKVLITGLTEAGEEAVQEIIQRTALGEEVVMDDEMKTAMAIGGIMGLGLGVGGDVLSGMMFRTVETIPTPLLAAYQEAFDAAKATGLTDELAAMKGLDAIAATEEGRAHIEAQVEKTIIEERRKEVVADTPAEQAVWNKRFDDQIAEIEAREAEVAAVEPPAEVVPGVEPAAAPEVAPGVPAPEAVVEPVAEVEPVAPAVPAPVSPTVPRRVPPVVPTEAETALVTTEEADAAIEQFAQLIAAPDQRSLWEETLQLRKKERAIRAAALGPRTKQLVDQGLSIEEALKQAEKDVLSGALPTALTNLPQVITDTIRPALFAKIDQELTGFERASTRTALVNALAGKPIPRRPGVTGRSALTRLQALFPPKIIEALQHPGGIEAFLEENRPQPIGVEDQQMREYLTTLPPSEQGLLLGFDQPVESRLGEEPYAQPPAPVDPRPLSQRILDFARLTRGAKLDAKLQAAFDAPAWIPPDASVTMTEAERIRNAIDIQRIMRRQPPEGVAGGIPDFPGGTARELALMPEEDRQRLWTLAKDSGMTVVDLFNFIRAVRASVDFSAWRQMAPLILGNLPEFMVANADMFKAAWSAEHAKSVNTTIQRRPEFVIYDKLNLDFLRPFDPKAVAAWQKTEEFIIQGKETFFGRLADKMPFIRIGARAHITFTNKMGFDIWAKYIRDLGGVQTVLADPELLDTINKLGKMLAEMSGRGPLGPFKAASQVINAGIFAARFTTGRLFAPRWLVSANPYVRKQAWKNWLTFVGGFAGIIQLGVVMGLWETEFDPRNPDFMKIRIGSLRIDPWGGQQQVVVLLARLISGEQISSTTGMKRSVDLLDTLQHYSRGKGSPLTQWVLEATTGKTFLGEEVDLTDLGQWAERIAPFALLDIYEAFEEEGMAGVFWGALPAIFGANVQAYGNDYFAEFKGKLGLPNQEGDPVPEIDGMPVSIEDEPFYTMSTWAGDINRRITGVPQEDITEGKGFPPEWVHYAEARENRIVFKGLSSQKPIQLNTDPEQGNSLEEFRRQGVLIAETPDPEEQALLRVEFPNAITQRTYDLLIDYHIIKETGTREQLATFIDEHPELNQVARSEWLKGHPTENANLALWGYAPVASEQAFDELEALIEKFDITSAALPVFALPPRESLDTHFEYEELVDARQHASWEAQLLLANDDAYRIWRGLAPVDTPTAALELKTESVFRETFNQLDAIADADSRFYIADEDARAAERERLKATGIGALEYRDIERRIEAIEEGTNEEPTPDETVRAWAERGRVVDESGGTSQEAKLYLLDNPDVHQWALDHELLTTTREELLEDEEIIRHDVEFGAQQEAYDAIQGDTDEGTQAERREAFLLLPENEAFRKDRRRRDAHSMEFPDAVIEDYVSYYELPDFGDARDRFRVEHPELDAVLTDTAFMDDTPLVAVDPEALRDPEYDVLYQQWFDQIREYDQGIPLKHSGIAERETRERLISFDRQLLFEENPEFHDDRLRFEAHKAFIRPQFVEDYVNYYSLESAGFDQERYLKARPDFYEEMKAKLEWTSDINFTKVPTEKFEDALKVYNLLPKGNARVQYRFQNPWFDVEGVTLGRWQSVDERYTPTDPIQQAIEETEKRLKDLEDRARKWR